MRPLSLYLPVSNPETGFECLRVELTSALVERISRALQVLIRHDFSAASFGWTSAQWFKLSQCVEQKNLTVNVWRTGTDYGWGIEFFGEVNLTDGPGQYRWAYPKAQWPSFLEQEKFSMLALFGLANTDGCIIEQGDFCGDPNFKVSPRFLRSVSYAQLTVGEYSKSETALAHITVFEECMPVQGKRTDLLALQAVLDDLDNMPTHGLDFADVHCMYWQKHKNEFEPPDYRCKKLNLLSLSAQDSWSECFANIVKNKLEHSELNVWLITTSINELKTKNQEIRIGLRSVNLVLTTYVVQDASTNLLGDRILFVIY
jgi:hypothetical protein